MKYKFATKGFKIGQDGLFSFLRSEHLLIEPKHSYHISTNFKHWLHKYPNLLKNAKAEQINEVWASDITYVDTQVKTAYIF